MVTPTIANIVGPTIPPDDPDTFTYQGIGQTKEIVYASMLRGCFLCTAQVLQALLEQGHALALGVDPSLAGLVRLQDGIDQFLSQDVGALGEQLRGVFLLL